MKPNFIPALQLTQEYQSYLSAWRHHDLAVVQGKSHLSELRASVLTIEAAIRSLVFLEVSEASMAKAQT